MKAKVGRMLRREEVERRLNLSTSALYRGMRAGVIPLPKRVGIKAVRWDEDEIESYLANAERARGDVGKPVDAA